MSDLGTELRRYYESVVERIDPLEPTTDRTRPVDYTAQTGLAIAVLAALIVGVVFGLLPILLSTEPADNPVTTMTTPPATSPSVSTTLAEPSQPNAFANPLLAAFYQLEECDETDEFSSWVDEMLPGAFAAELVATDIETVMTAIPLYRSPVAACVSGFIAASANGQIEAAAWLMLDQSGNLIARAVGFQTEGGEGALIDDPELRALNGEYHQDWLGSGQSFTGWVADELIAADVGLGAGVWMRTLIEIPGFSLPTEGRIQGRAGSDVVALLSLAELAPIREGSETVLPNVLPADVIRCMGPSWNGRIEPIPEPIEVTSYCDASGVVLQIGESVGGFSPPESFVGTIEIAGVTFNRYRVDEGDLLLTASLTYGTDLIVRSSLDLNSQLIAVLASIELVELREGLEGIANIRSGSDNYRSVFSEQWLRDQLDAAGASNIQIEPITFQSGANGFQAFFQPADHQNLQLTGQFSTYPQDARLQDPFVNSERQTYEQVTIFVLRPNGVDNTTEHQALAYCGGITLHAIGDVVPGTDPNPVIETIRTLIFNIDC